MQFEYDVVGKIGSMALIRKSDNDIDYNIFSKIGSQLKPGMIWVSSGATEIGRLDYMHRTGRELAGDMDEIKTDYAAQGQAILMENYRRFVKPEYSLRQVLLEHQHFNDEDKRAHIKGLLLRAKAQGAIPIVNYNDPVSFEENRKMELASYENSTGHKAVECIDNDETAAVIAELVRARTLVIMSNIDGIYKDHSDPSTLVREVHASTPEKLERDIDELRKCCFGASRAGANGAGAKLHYIKGPAMQGTTVIIGNARYGLEALLSRQVPCTVIGLR